MQEELVSIIMPSYNSGKYIRASIDSILNQTYSNFELLIADDHSTDCDTISILKDYAKKDNRIRIFLLEENKGAGFARNYCIKEARGKYIAFCDSDDRWLPEKLKKELILMKEKKCDVVFSSYFTCTDNGEINGLIQCRSKETAFSIKCDDKMGNLTFMYNEEKTGKLYMPLQRKRQDWVHKMVIMDICKIAYGVKEPLAIYRLTDNSISRKKSSLAKYNIKGFMTLGWSKYKATLFFLFFFLPTYFLKILKRKIGDNHYNDYLYLIPDSMLHSH